MWTSVFVMGLALLTAHDGSLVTCHSWLVHSYVPVDKLNVKLHGCYLLVHVADTQVEQKRTPGASCSGELPFWSR
jgi:hypothetical protein